MRPEDFGDRAPGDVVPVEIPASRPGRDETIRAHAFCPHPLPPVLELRPRMLAEAEAAAHALGRLDGLVASGTNVEALAGLFVRAEAIASSWIEGYRTTLGALALHETVDLTATASDVQRAVMANVAALELGLDRVDDREASTALVRELHGVLMSGPHGRGALPGRYREVFAYIGGRWDGFAGARYVPPPPDHVPALMSQLEPYLADPPRVPLLPRLVTIALVHYQFEAVHPFADGNGRIGRLITSLLLRRWGLLHWPVIDVSANFVRRRRDYYDGLLAVSRHGDWEDWVELVLTAIRCQAEDAARRVVQLVRLRDDYRSRFTAQGPAGVEAVIDRLFRTPVVGIRGLADDLGMHYATAQRAVAALETAGILREVTGKRRDRRYAAEAIIDTVSDTG